MQSTPVPFQDAVARAREIAQKLAASAPMSQQNNSLKRSNNDEDGANKRPAFDLSDANSSELSPVQRAQMIAQKISSQLGTYPSSGSSSSNNSGGMQEDYRIPDKFVGLVIGKGGEQIVRIQQESGCKVKISNIRPSLGASGSNPPDRIANLSGSREAIECAKKIIEDIVSRGKIADGSPASLNPYSLGGTSAKAMDVMLPSAKCGLIIGKGGETIRRISEELGVKMFVVQELIDIDGIEHKPLKISGDPDKVERAKQYVMGILDRSAPGSSRAGGNSSNDSGSRSGGGLGNGIGNEVAYYVPYDKAGAIIGKGGESVKEICRRSGALVEVDKNHLPSMGGQGERLFRIRGTPDQIVLAQQLMYDRVLNSSGGPGDVLTPIQFQQKYNLPLVGAIPSDSWSGTTDPYGANSSSSSDLYSQWASAYAQWPQMNPYDDGTGKATNNGTPSSTNNPAGANAMDPAWLAYYQSMNFYNMMQSSVTGNPTSTANPSSNATDTTTTTTANASGSSTAATSSTAGQPDYTKQWIEYYRSIGQNDLADQIAQQTNENGAAAGTQAATGAGTTPAAPPAAGMMSSQDAWAAYAQQWANNQMAANTSNGQNSSNTH